MPHDRGDMCGVGVVVGEEARLGVLRLTGMAGIAGITGVARVARTAGMDCSLGLMLGRSGQREGFGETSLRVVVWVWLRVLVRLMMLMRLVLLLLLLVMVLMALRVLMLRRRRTEKRLLVVGLIVANDIVRRRGGQVRGICHRSAGKVWQRVVDVRAQKARRLQGSEVVVGDAVRHRHCRFHGVCTGSGRSVLGEEGVWPACFLLRSSSNF